MARHDLYGVRRLAAAFVEPRFPATKRAGRGLPRPPLYLRLAILSAAKDLSSDAPHGCGVSLRTPRRCAIYSRPAISLLLKAADFNRIKGVLN